MSKNLKFRSSNLGRFWLRFFCLLGVFFFTKSLAFCSDFVDIPATHPQAEAINYLATEGILRGYADGTFRANQVINRVEFLKIVLLINKIPITQQFSSTFSDVQSTDWFAGFVETAVQQGLITGYSDQTFQPEQTVILAEALKILLLAAEINLASYTEEQQVFAHAQPAWYIPYFNYAEQFALLTTQISDQPDQLLTRGAATELIYRFLTRVDRICPLLLGNSQQTIPIDYFANITLEQALPSVFYERESFLIQGEVQVVTDIVTVILVDEFGEQFVFTEPVEDQDFAIVVDFQSLGFFNFVILPGSDGQGFATLIEVLPWECQPDILVQESEAPRNLEVSLQANEPFIVWENTTNNLTLIVLRQAQQRFERLVSGGQNSLQLDPADFEDWEEGLASLQIFGAQSAHGFSFEPHTSWQEGESQILNLAAHFFTELKATELELTQQPFFREEIVELRGYPKVPLAATIYLIEPNGEVSELALTNESEFLPVGEEFSFQLELTQPGPYFLEINNAENLAALNQPIYEFGTLPLLPDFQDLREPLDPEREIFLNREKLVLFRLLNSFRAEQGLSYLILDPEISQFAQAYAEQMVAEDFFGHVDPQGLDPEARQQKFGLNLPVSENLAHETKAEYAHAGLLRSAVHRQNILNPAWRRLGLGIAVTPENGLIFVEEFSLLELTSKNLTTVRQEILAQINAERAQAGLAALTLDQELAEISQAWSNKMVVENFFALEAGENSLEQDLATQDLAKTFQLSILTLLNPGNLELNQDLQAIILQSDLTQLAIGVAQDSQGLFYLTMILV